MPGFFLAHQNPFFFIAQHSLVQDNNHHKGEIMLTRLIRKSHNGMEIKFGVYDAKSKKKGWKPL